MGFFSFACDDVGGGLVGHGPKSYVSSRLFEEWFLSFSVSVSASVKGSRAFFNWGMKPI